MAGTRRVWKDGWQEGRVWKDGYHGTKVECGRTGAVPWHEGRVEGRVQYHGRKVECGRTGTMAGRSSVEGRVQYHVRTLVLKDGYSIMS